MPRKRSTKKKTVPAIDPELVSNPQEITAREAAATPGSTAEIDTSATEPPTESATPEARASVEDDVPEAASVTDADDDGDKRLSARQVRRIKTVVHYKETHSKSWKEIIEVETVSRNGAALMLPRPCPIGRLVTLVMDMPRELRVYDHFAPAYPVAGVVQNCTEIMADDRLVYHVGVAFIGKQLPATHREDPLRTYRINGVDNNGLWRVAEAGNDFAPRRDVRYWQSVPVTISYRDDKRKAIERAVVTTRDVSRGGMAVFGSLDVSIGDRLKVSSKAHSFFTMAVVCNRTDHPRDETKSLLHLQFDGNRFPVHMLSNPEEDAADGPEHKTEQVPE